MKKAPITPTKALKLIAQRLNGIHRDDLSTAESQIIDILVVALGMTRRAAYDRDDVVAFEV